MIIHNCNHTNFNARMSLILDRVAGNTITHRSILFILHNKFSLKKKSFTLLVFFEGITGRSNYYYYTVKDDQSFEEFRLEPREIFVRAVLS